MAVIRVFAHHQSPPTSFGTMPLAAGFPAATWTYWAELADDATVLAEGFGPPPAPGTVTNAAGTVVGTAVPKPVDGSYLTGAINFGVQQVGIVFSGGLTTNYDFRLVSPTNTVIPVPLVGGVVVPGVGTVYWVPFALATAKGVWKVEVLPVAGFGGAPNEVTWSAAAAWPVPFVTLTGTPREGTILAVAFDGDIVVTTTTMPPTTTSTTTKPPTTTQKPTTTSTTSTTTSTSTTTTAAPPTSTTTGRPTTTTRGPTTSTTTGRPTTSTTTRSPTTSTTAGPTAPPTMPPGPLGCICTLLLVAALALLGAAAVMLMIWGCSGFIAGPTLTAAIAAAVLALILLAIWIVVCRPCPQAALLARILLGLAALMVVIAIVFVLIGQVGCAVGALATAILFAIVGAIVRAIATAVGCP
jgi:hypothetical protein